MCGCETNLQVFLVPLLSNAPHFVNEGRDLSLIWII